MGAFEDGSSFIAGVLAKLPDSLRPQVKEALEKPEAKDAITLVGESVLARSDYSRQMDALKAKENELQTKFEDLNSWYGVNETALKDYNGLKTEVETLRAKLNGGTPPPKKEEVVDPRQIALDVVNETGREYVQVSAWLAGKAVQHQQMFGEPLDTMAIVNNPKLGKPIAGQPGRVFSLNDAYTEAHGERLATKQKEVEDQRINAEVDKRLKEKLANQSQPFPLRGESSPSVLDVLATKDGPAAHNLDSAVAEYDRLQAARG